MEVYRIYNKKNGKSYIGVTLWRFKERYSGGSWWKWTHSNHLKMAVAKYGLNNFEVEILNNTAKSEKELYELEISYIKQYNSYIPHGYNLTKGGGNPNPLVREYELIDYNGTVYQVNNLAEFCRKNKISYGAMLNLVSGLTDSSYGFALSSTKLEKIRNPNQEWLLENLKTGDTEIVNRNSVVKWAIQQKLNIGSIWNLLRGDCLLSQGWKLKDTNIPNNYTRGTKYKNTQLLSPDNKIITIESVYSFCLKNGLERSSFYNLINGKTLSVHGWRLPCSEKEFQEKKDNRIGKTFKLKINQTGKIIEIKNLRAFARENKLILQRLYNILNKVSITYAGFCLPETDILNYIPRTKYTKVSIINESGIIMEDVNPKRLQKKTNISSESIKFLILGKYKECKGWRLHEVEKI